LIREAIRDHTEDRRPWLSAAVGIPKDPDKEFQCNWLHSNCGRLLKIGQLWILLAIVRLLRSLQHAATFLVELIFCAAVKGAR
jgi:hypothetical protein